MKSPLFLFSLFLFLISCNDNSEKKLVWEQYANENGEIKLAQLNDSIVQVVFTNNDGFVFDPLGKQTLSSSFLDLNSGETFIQIGTGGIEKGKNGLWVHNFTSIAQLQMDTKIPEIYSRMFYRISEEIEITGMLDGSNKGKKVDGIYLPMMKIRSNEYYRFRGRLRREPVPISFYSTENSPQGMYGDTNQLHYRLIFEPNVTIDPIHPKLN